MTTVDCDDFLKDISLKMLTRDAQEALEADLMMEDQAQALRGFQSGKAPGPNSFPVELYEGMVDIVAKPMLAMFQEACKEGCLPEDQRTAAILVINKGGKQSIDCGSYRSISLLNVGAKVLAKALATRLRGGHYLDCVSGPVRLYAQ
ncbi:hypothetical protein NDU88_006654 [Pleurodeles waltl]|uniref:Uncharacterized protein n=1 Tax=Pleurodeles waltl TaxID=8319 RepID=A0AAV7NQV8_PLEWA|nr:hypothetical protein NDU88_006654 [Pleurodeles waltl]